MFCSRCGASIEGTPSYCPNCGAPVAAVVAAAAMPAAGGFAAPMPAAGAGVVYAGFWRRFCSAFLDGLLLNIATFPISMMVMIPMSARMESVSPEDFTPQEFASFLGVYFMLFVTSTVISWLYAAFMMSSGRQATVGMMALGLLATDLQGRRLSFARASGRYFATIVTGLTLGIGYLVMFFNDRRQTLHDVIAGTLIVRKT